MRENKTVMKYAEFNERKKAGYAAQTKEEFANWQTDFKQWWNKQQFANEEQKQNLLQQIKDLTDKKTAWLDKQGNRPTVVRNSYIFQDELAQALTEYIKVRTELLRKQMLVNTSAEPYQPAPMQNIPSITRLDTPMVVGATPVEKTSKNV